MSAWVFLLYGNQARLVVVVYLGSPVYLTTIWTVILSTLHFVVTVLLSLPRATSGVTSHLHLQHGVFQRNHSWKV